ncbi:MAG TPA: glycosyltransferase family 2 protein [Noviherbaspirillum sp.]|nr:glycosyltransferase family 2 protein [Noviherbaspirillum sp.]
MKHPPRASDVTVVIVTYNSAHCIAGLAPGLASMPHVTVVDNASNDDTVAEVERLIPQAKLVRNPRNLGFGAANNLALREVTTPFALLLNPDCLPEHAALAGLLETAQRFPEAAIIAPHLLGRSGKLELNYRWSGLHWTSRGPAAEGPCCVGFACGAVMLFNMEVMREVGLFDEDFFLYYEDEDLCHRVLAARRQIIVAPHVTVQHLSRGSVRGNSPLRAEFLRGFHHAQSKLIFTAKHRNAGRTARLRWKTLALALATLPPRLLVPAPRHLARLLGRIWGLCVFKRAPSRNA